MRTPILILSICCSAARADGQVGIRVDTLRTLDRITMGTNGSKTYKLNLLTEITNKLDLIMDKYAQLPNVPNTWVLIRRDASDMLASCFQAGYFPASKVSQAYSVSMGPETMTQADIKSGRKVLVVGVALKVPAEFTLLRIVRNGP